MGPGNLLKGAGHRLGQTLSALKGDADVKISNREAFHGEGEPKVGIALSGGGIRSAAFNLGVLQTLRECGILDKAAHLTAVSGGAYIASAVALTQYGIETRGKPQGTPAWGSGTPEEEHLRNNTSYIAPTPWKKAEALGAWARGFLLNLLILIFVLIVMGTSLGWLFAYMHPALAEEATIDGIQEHRYLWFALGVWSLGFMLFLFDALADLSMWRWHTLRSGARRLMTAGIVLALVFVIPYLLLVLRSIRDDPISFAAALGFAATESSAPLANWVGLAQAAAAVNIVVAAIRGLLAKKSSLYVQVVAAVAGPLLILLSLFAIIDHAAYVGFSVNLPGVLPAESALLGIGIAGAFVFLDILFNCNKTTLHHFYAHRLSTVFAVRRAGAEAERMSDQEPIRLSEQQPSTGPQFTYCAAANAIGDGTTPPGRNAVPFVFSRDYCGGTVVGTITASSLETCAPWLSVPAAVAISGAAFSPTMGKHTRRTLTFLMTLMNLRLGVWMPNPNFTKEIKSGGVKAGRIRGTWRAALSRFFVRVSPNLPKPGLRYLVYEFLGWHRLDRRYLYVTDGGHYDNLGLVELMRHGCNMIYCFDASGDSMETFNTLGEAIAIARSDHGVQFDIEPERLRPEKEDGLCKYGHVVGHFTFRAADNQPVVPCTLVFVKAAVTRSSPWDVRAFRGKDPDFPNHSTADQLFTDQKFESYRALGAHQTRRALESLASLRRPVFLDGDSSPISNDVGAQSTR